MTASRTYWLRIDHNTEQLSTNKGGGGTPAGSVAFTFKRSDRTLLASGLTGTGDGGENFFGPLITTEPVSQDLTVANIDSAGGNASLQIVIQGGTDSIQHQVRVEIHGQHTRYRDPRQRRAEDVQLLLPAEFPAKRRECAEADVTQHRR